MVDKNIIEAFRNRDVSQAKSAFYTIALYDPGFKTGKFDEALNYLREAGFDELFDEYDGEELLSEEQWNDEYFDLTLSGLYDNFSEERIDFLKKIGRKLYENTSPRENKEAANQQNMDFVINEEKASENDKWVSYIVIGGMILTVLLAGKTILKLIFRLLFGRRK